MALSSNMISQLAKVTRFTEKPKGESIVYGTIVDLFGELCVKIDGAEDGVLTPVDGIESVSSTIYKSGDRVLVTIKNHAAIVTGNVTDKAVTSTEFTGLVQTMTRFDGIVANVVHTDSFSAVVARVNQLETDDVNVQNTLTAATGEIDRLKATDVQITRRLDVYDATIGTIVTDKLDANEADARYARIDELEATGAAITTLSSDHAMFKEATATQLAAVDGVIKNLNTTYANIDFSNIGKAAMEWFYANSGLIKDVTINNGTITGNLVGVTISGDLIEGNTVKAEKLVIKGSDGLYYKLNTDGVATEAQQTDQNSINGSIIKAKSITASKLSVEDLVAFDATIGGFHISENSVYSGVKESVGNTTRGIFLGSDGQMAVGDNKSYLKYYKKTDGTYALEVSADAILLSSGKNIEEAVSDIEVGGTNLLVNSETKSIVPYSATEAVRESNVEVTEWMTVDAKRIYGTTGETSVIFGTLGGTAGYAASREDQMYTATIYIKNNHATNRVTVSANHGSSLFEDVLAGECKRVELVGPGNGWGYLQLNFKTPVAGDEFDITYWRPKIELGNTPTDWSPAPEDMATSDDVDAVTSSVEANETRLTDAEALIELLSESISMLVTDGNGASLMKQTDNGWTFSTGDIQDAVNRTSEALDTLTNDVGDVNSAIDVLTEAVRDLGTLSDYIKIGTYENEPCIELGESDSDFKLLITNTRIMFREGTGVPAYFTNQSMHIKKAVVEEELQQGGFVWKARANGNL